MDHFPSFEEYDPLDTNLPAPSSRSRGVGRVFTHVIREAWHPTPLLPPQVDPDLSDLHTLERTAEVFRYSGARLEYTLSPSGLLRAWFNLNLVLALFLGVPIILLMPVVTMGLASLASWSGYMLAVMGNLFDAVLFALKTLLCVTCGLLVLRFFFGGWIRL